MRRLLPVVVLPVLLAAGCGGDSGTASSGSAGSAASSEVDVVDEPVTQPRTEAAVRKAAEEYLSTFASGDYAGAWALLAEEAQNTLGREDYLKVFQQCPSPSEGVPSTIEAVRLDDQNTATVRSSRLGFKFSHTYKYEGGRWVYLPDAKALADYRLGPDKLVAKRKAEGGCG